MKNYNNELEAILENKPFDVEVKNILLNMLYKINTSYKDYENVKRNVEEEKFFIESILDTIENLKEINLIKPLENEDNKKIYNKIKVDKLKHKIEVYPNEETMLYAINEFNSVKMYLNEKNYKLIKNSLPELINKGKAINDTEIIRDFDAWTWNVQVDEIESIETNLIYQNMQLLLGYKKMNELLNLKSLKSDLSLLENSFKALYGEEQANAFMYLVYKISIILIANQDEEERQRLLTEKKWIENEYNRLNNKNKLLDDITASKKVIMDKIKEIDIILNNKELLTKEYNKRNSNLPDHSKIFSISHFSEILYRERENYMHSINEYNKLLAPKNYAKMKLKFEKDLELLSNIKLDGKIKNAVTKPMLSLQMAFLNCFEVQIEKAETKKEILYLLYALRYYNFIPFSKTECIKDLKEIRAKRIELEISLIEKMYAYKIINKNMELNLVDKIFYTKIIKLENIEFELKSNKQAIVLALYDEDTIAETIEVDINDIDVKKVKFNKRYKLFN